MRWRNKDFDSGEEKDVGIVLFEGELPEAFTVTLAGVEVDATGPADDALHAFERSVRDSDARFAYSVTEVIGKEEVEKIAVSGFALGAIAGAVVGGIVGSTVKFEIVIQGIVIATLPEGSIIGGILEGTLTGGVIGTLIAIGIITVALLISVIANWLGPDPMMLDRTMYMGASLSNAVAIPGMAPSAWSAVSRDYGITVEGYYSRDDNGDLLEFRRYQSRAEESDYTFVFRHHFGW